MPTVTVPSANVTVEQVSAVLREKLGPRYKITPATTSRFHHQFPAGETQYWSDGIGSSRPASGSSPAPDSTEIHVGSAANFTPTGLLINRAGIMHKVHQVLQRAPELASS